MVARCHTVMTVGHLNEKNRALVDGISSLCFFYCDKLRVKFSALVEAHTYVKLYVCTVHAVYAHMVFTEGLIRHEVTIV